VAPAVLSVKHGACWFLSALHSYDLMCCKTDACMLSHRKGPATKALEAAQVPAGAVVTIKCGEDA